MERKYFDCREVPSKIGCSLRISGTEEEVLHNAIRHAVEDHREMNSPQLRQTIQSRMRDVPDSGEIASGTDRASPDLH